MSLRVYNTLSKQKEPFETVQPGKVGIYLCGPTVYKAERVDIGHMVGPVSSSATPVAMRIDLTDVDGRTAQIEGTNVNRFVVNLYPSLLVWECQTHWTMDGIDLVGEDEDNWGIHDFRRYLRRRQGATA